jgi:isopenicillin-N N-acyltransferase-like protein
MESKWSAGDVREIAMSEKWQAFNSNDYLMRHDNLEDVPWIEDGKFRVSRIEELVQNLGNDPGLKEARGVFKATTNWPHSTCRSAEGKSKTATLFNTVMILKKKRASVTIGRPAEPKGLF